MKLGPLYGIYQLQIILLINEMNDVLNFIVINYEISITIHPYQMRRVLG